MAPNITPPSKRRKIDYTEEIIVLVGAEEKRFVVHKSVITARSAFFRAAAVGSFKEAKEGIIRLPEMRVEAFAIYVQWIYSNEIVVLDAERIEEDITGAKQGEHLIELYILADKLDDKRLRNQVTDELTAVWRSVERGPTSRDITRIWHCTRESSKMRRLILDSIMQSGGGNWLAKHKDNVPSGFMIDLAIAYAHANWDRSKVTDPENAPACTYHERDDTLPPCA